MKNTLQDNIAEAGRILADKQVCRIYRIPDSMTATPCDFGGYTRDGQAILIEAKMVNRPRLPIGKSPGLKPHQWNELCDAARAGVITLLAWQRDDVLAILSVAEVQFLATGAKSIPWNQQWFYAADPGSVERQLRQVIELLSIRHRQPSLEQEPPKATHENVLNPAPRWRS